MRLPGQDRRTATCPLTSPTVPHCEPIYYAVSKSASPGITMMRVSTRSIAVTGMSCDHCASAIRAEISRLPGVTGIDVDVATGTVRVSGDPLPGDVSLREAVEEAGYEFAG